MTSDPANVGCPFCGAAAGDPCVYAEGPFRGTVKISGPHSQRVSALDVMTNYQKKLRGDSA